MRPRLNRALGVVLLAVFVASWTLPGGLSLPGGIILGGDSTVREVPPRLHSGTQWAIYLAPEGTCPGDGSVDSGAAEQLSAMRCLLDWARSRRGLPRLPMDAALIRSSQLKAEAIARCADFSHTPCGAAFPATFDAAGWKGSSGENIAWGASLARSPRLLVDGWLHSDGHRENLFRVAWEAQGLALLRPERFEGETSASIWVHQFGARVR